MKIIILKFPSQPIFKYFFLVLIFSVLFFQYLFNQYFFCVYIFWQYFFFKFRKKNITLKKYLKIGWLALFCTTFKARSSQKKIILFKI